MDAGMDRTTPDGQRDDAAPPSVATGAPPVPAAWASLSPAARSAEKPDASSVRRSGDRRRLALVSAVAAGLLLLSAVLGVGWWRARSDAARQAAVAASFRARIERVSTRNASLAAASATLRRTLAELRSNVKRSVGNLEHPHFILWNSCGTRGPADGCPLAPGQAYIGGVPDTFTYIVSFRATVPVSVWIMSPPNFICYQTKTCAWHAVGWQDQRQLTGAVFHDAEGCAGYIVVFVSKQAGTIYPNVSVTRNPSRVSTGACA